MGFRKGAKAAEEAEKNKSKGGGFKKVEYFGLDPEESQVVRFLTDYDNWLLIKEHTFIKTRDPNGHGLPAKTVENWPKVSNGTCRYDEAFINDDGTRQYDDCYCCDHMLTDKNRPLKPKERLYALVAIRDEVIGTQEMVDEGEIPARKLGKVIGYEDRYKEVADTDENGKPIEGQTKEILDVQIACFAWSNFFQSLQVLAESYEETVLDRDIMITRKGEKLETKYMFAALAPINFTGFDPDNPGEERVFTVQDQDVLDYYTEASDGLPDLEAVVSERATDFHYARFFDVNQPIPLREYEKEQVAKEGTGGGPKKAASRPTTRRGPVRPGGASAAPVASAEDDEEGVEDETGEDTAESEATVDVERRQKLGDKLRDRGRRETADA